MHMALGLEKWAWDSSRISTLIKWYFIHEFMNACIMKLAKMVPIVKSLPPTNNHEVPPSDYLCMLMKKGCDTCEIGFVMEKAHTYLDCRLIW